MAIFKDLLVVVDDSAACAGRLDLAVRLAVRFGAHVIGLYVYETPVIAGYARTDVPAGLRVGNSIVPSYLVSRAETLEALRQAQQEMAGRARELFRKQAEVAGITTEWRAREGDVGRIAMLHARYADLVIVGQADPDAAGSESLREIPQQLLLGVGRPILAVPYTGTFRTIGERVLVAWNASREATRAVNDALPLLQTATQVTVLAINPRDGVSGEGEVPGADLALHLSRHGVKAEASWLHADDVTVAALLLSRLADLQADLLVMGGYGHSRMREIVLGGVTREILQAMTVPTLLSH